MMQHLIILPIVLPMFTGLLMLLNRNGATRPRRFFAMVSTSLLVVVGILLLKQSSDDVIRYYALGDWQPPFGIILVLDRLSAMMVLLTAVLALGSVIYACAGDDEQGSFAGAVGDATRHHFVDVQTRGAHQSYVVD